MNPDKGLIQQPSNMPSQTKATLFSFLAIQIFQVILFFLSISWSLNILFVFIHILLALANFVLCQRYFGRNLVGLSWKFNFQNLSESLWSYEIEPDPFVPTKLNSNAFWVGIASSSMFWIFATIFLLFSDARRGWHAILTSLIIFAIHSLNLSMFFRVQKIATKLSAEAVRTVLLGKSEFPNAEEFSSTDSENSESSKESNDHKE